MAEKSSRTVKSCPSLSKVGHRTSCTICRRNAFASFKRKLGLTRKRSSSNSSDSTLQLDCDEGKDPSKSRTSRACIKWETMIVDYVRGRIDLLVFVNQETLYPEVFHIRNPKSLKEMKQAFRDMFREYGIPKTIISPAEYPFDDRELRMVMRVAGVEHSEELNYLLEEDWRVDVVIKSLTLLAKSGRVLPELRSIRRRINRLLKRKGNKGTQIIGNEEATIPDEHTLLKELTELSIDEKPDQLNGLSYDDRNALHIESALEDTYDSSSEEDFQETLRDARKDSPLKCDAEDSHMILMDDSNRNLDMLFESVNRDVTFKVTYVTIESTGRTSEVVGSLRNKQATHLPVESTATNTQKSGYGDPGAMNVKTKRRCQLIKDELCGPLMRFPLDTVKMRYGLKMKEDMLWKYVAVALVVDVHKACLLFVDCISKYPEVVLVDLFTKKSSICYPKVIDLCNAFYYIFQRNGKPIEMYTTKDRLFQSRRVRNIFTKNEIAYYFNSVYLECGQEMSDIMETYKYNLLRDYQCYFFILKLQKILNETMGREIKSKRSSVHQNRQRTVYSLSSATTLPKTTGSELTISINATSNARLNATPSCVYTRSNIVLVMDQVVIKGLRFLIFLESYALYPQVVELCTARECITNRVMLEGFRTLTEIWCKPSEIHVSDTCTFAFPELDRFCLNERIYLYRQSHLMNGSSIQHKALMHMKHVLAVSADVYKGLEACRDMPIPELRQSPKSLVESMSRVGDIPGDKPWDSVIIDIMRWNGKHLLVFIDTASLYPETRTIRNLNLTRFTRNVVNKLKQLCLVFGTPKVLLMPNKRTFHSSSFRQFFKSRNIKHRTLDLAQDESIFQYLVHLEYLLYTSRTEERPLSSLRSAVGSGITAVDKLRELERRRRSGERQGLWKVYQDQVHCAFHDRPTLPTSSHPIN